MIFDHYGIGGLLFALFFAHALADFPLQQEFIAQAKKPDFWKEQESSNGFEWIFILGAHSIIHGGLVWLVSGSLLLGTIEVTLHFTIDHLRNKQLMSFTTDQLLHLCCKVAYLFFFLT